ncbi:MAG: T9SS type A sorting domain-containing protein [Candidatus Marinimicrobia bacterium]|nr:T9SS type A sorting domain-containing protein [Candidatus Neomarinimicrobiota bacterium]
MFIPQYTIPYALDVSEHIRIDLLDVSGRIIRNLVNRGHMPGEYNVLINDSFLSTGVYFIRIQAGSQIEVQKIIMMK